METQFPSTPLAPISCCSPKSKLLCLSAGSLVLLLIAILSFFFGRASVKPSPLSRTLPSPTIAIPTPTAGETVYTEATRSANWKTYTNPKYNYSVKYPPEWFIYDKGTYWPQEKIYKNVQEITFISPQQREDLTPGGFSLMNSLLIRGDLGAFIESGIDKNIYKTEQTLLGGLPVTKVVTIAQPAMGGFETHYNFSYKGKNYEIAFSNNDLNGTHNPIFDQILSTFRFD